MKTIITISLCIAVTFLATPLNVTAQEMTKQDYLEKNRKLPGSSCWEVV